ncbi:MAG: hypothetical protein MMC33_003639 [Icmadophila ericetorum]|nr:hypothetical protein [Icmadophila ericetorum]
MLASRTAVRCLRLNSRLIAPKGTRLYANAAPQANSGLSHGVIGGAVGGGLVFAIGYGYYHFSGAKTLVQTAKSISNNFKTAGKKLKDSSPEPNEALEYLRKTASSYAAFIPGAKYYVDSAFDELDAIRNKHGKEVDDIVRDAYNELKAIPSEKGLSVEGTQKAWDIIQKHMSKLGHLASDAASDIINNHPELKEKVGGNIDQLKQMGDKYGPEAKKQVDQTWQQIQDIVKGGMSAESANKIRQVVQEKIEFVKKMGDEAWKKGMEQAKPYLEKNPKVKELVEKNADSLKQGNVAQLWNIVKEAASSGNTDDLEKYVKSTAENAKQQGSSFAGSIGGAGGSIQEYFKQIPGADQVLPKIEQLQEVAKKHGKEAEKLVKEAWEEVGQVLSKKVSEAEELAEKAKKDSKK